MIRKWMALIGIAALLSACAHPGGGEQAQAPWNGGIWNSVLGYVGPHNEMADEPRR